MVGNMPAKYLKMRRAMRRTYGKKLGTKYASMKWNKEHKGTGRTVGRGRR